MNHGRNLSAALWRKKSSFLNKENARSWRKEKKRKEKGKKKFSTWFDFFLWIFPSRESSDGRTSKLLPLGKYVTGSSSQTAVREIHSASTHSEWKIEISCESHLKFVLFNFEQFSIKQLLFTGQSDSLHHCTSLSRAQSLLIFQLGSTTK